MTVSFNGHVWKARWWTQGETPGVAEVWADQGTCGPPPPPPPPGTCTLPVWSSTTAYVGGSVVQFGGHKWTAKWWTQGDKPGQNAQDVWIDNGNCTS
jgi:chitinase